MVQSWGDLLLRFFQNINQFSRLLGIGCGEETVGGAGLLGPCCAANTMDIVLSIVGKIKVDHKLNVMNICVEKDQRLRGETCTILLVEPL